MAVYRELSKLIEGSTVGELANDSSNIVELVKENYDVSLLCTTRMYIVKVTALIGPSVNMPLFPTCQSYMYEASALTVDSYTSLCVHSRP